MVDKSTTRVNDETAVLEGLVVLGDDTKVQPITTAAPGKEVDGDGTYVELGVASPKSSNHNSTIGKTNDVERLATSG